METKKEEFKVQTPLGDLVIAREKGATEFDKLCHKIFDAGAKSHRTRECGIRCHCGHKLETYYCEEQLFLVECPVCETKALVKARSPKEAAYKSFAFELRQLPTT